MQALQVVFHVLNYGLYSHKMFKSFHQYSPFLINCTFDPILFLK